MRDYLNFDTCSINAIKGVSIFVIVFFHIHCLASSLNFYIVNIVLPAFMFTSGILYFRFTRRHNVPGFNGGGINRL